MTQAPVPGAAIAPCAYSAPGKSINSDQYASSASPTPSAPTARDAAADVIPLWDSCSPGTAGACEKGSQCICQNQWYSQCRVQINGSWVPPGESWLCSQPDPNVPAESSSDVKNKVSSSSSSTATSSASSSSLPVAAEASASSTSSLALPQPSSLPPQNGNTIPSPPSAADSPNGQLVPQPEERNPDKIGSYLHPNATAEERALCSDPAAHQIRNCWNVLNVTGYAQDWVAYNVQGCIRDSMGFADCFLYIELGGGANCSSFTGRSQCPVPDVKAFTATIHPVQAYYVAFNIWNIQNWFFTYWLAIDGANGLTSENVGSICRVLDVPLPKPFPILEVLAIMAFALGFISPSGWGARIPGLGERVRGGLANIQVPGEYLLRGIQNSPTFSRNLLATGDLTKTDVQVDAIESSLALIVSQLQTNVQTALIDIMSNFTLFMVFVADGYFSTQIDNLNDIQQNVTKSLQTFAVSQALQDDNVIITRAVDTDVHALATNGTELNYFIKCTNGYDKWGMCDNWWYDADNHITYGLKSGKDIGLNYTDALEKLFEQGITTPELLFRGSQVCAYSAGATQGNAPGTDLDTQTGIWNAQCVSNMMICSWELAVFNREHVYTDCETEPDFALEGCGMQLDFYQARVPISYLGPWLTTGTFLGTVCNE